MNLGLSRQKSLLSISQEVIDIQSNEFGNTLEAIFTKIYSKIDNEDIYNHNSLKESQEIKNLEKEIFNRLGIKVTIHVDGMPAGILPLYSNKHSVFINDLFRGTNFKIHEQEKVLKKINDKKGYIDLARARVSGIFSEYNHHLYLNIFALKGMYKVSPAELTGITLHELGHAFEICEYSDRIATVNQVLSNASKEIFSDKKEKNLVYIYRELKAINKDITEEEVEKMVNGNRVITGYYLFKAVFGSDYLNFKNQTNDATYDRTSFEQLADNFATRFGYGRELITSLEKLHGAYDIDKNKATAAMAILMETLILVVCLLAITATGSIFFMLAGAFCLQLGLLISGEAVRDMTYDELQTRYKRIRNQYSEVLKNKEITKDELKYTIENIKIMDKIINETNINKGLFRTIANIILPSNRKAVNSIEEQKLLEELVHNDLFLKSAELKAIA